MEGSLFRMCVCHGDGDGERETRRGETYHEAEALFF